MKYLVKLSEEIEALDKDEAELMVFLKLAQQKIKFEVKEVKKNGNR